MDNSFVTLLLGYHAVTEFFRILLSSLLSEHDSLLRGQVLCSIFDLLDLVQIKQEIQIKLLNNLKKNLSVLRNYRKIHAPAMFESF